MNTVIRVLLLGWLSQVSLLSAAGWSAGWATVKITPDRPLWMAGYASREKPSEGTAQDIHAKALALQDASGTRYVLVTMDLLGFPADFTAEIADRARQRFGLDRQQVLFNASHTHSGPALARTLQVAYPMSPRQWSEVEAYTEELKGKIADLIGEALETIVPVRLSYGLAEASFAVNRRVRTAAGFVIGANRQGPVDHKVPFLTVDDEQGRLRAVMFGYACHNTTVRGDHYLFHGDYAGWAQRRLEERYPGVVALFVTGTAGDANPYPRGTPELARQHGQDLAKAVAERLTGPLQEVSGPMRAVFDTVDLPFSRLPSSEKLQERLVDENPFQRRLARLLLDRVAEDGALRLEYPYSIQVWKFGAELTLIGLAGEVVLDYALRLREELGSEGLWVAGYCNDVSSYIPSRRILLEGGYEAVDSMIYYGHPSPFAPVVEDRIIEKVLAMVDRLQ